MPAPMPAARPRRAGPPSFLPAPPPEDPAKGVGGEEGEGGESDDESDDDARREERAREEERRLELPRRVLVLGADNRWVGRRVRAHVCVGMRVCLCALWFAASWHPEAWLGSVGRDTLLVCTWEAVVGTKAADAAHRWRFWGSGERQVVFAAGWGGSL